MYCRNSDAVSRTLYIKHGTLHPEIQCLTDDVLTSHYTLEGVQAVCHLGVING